MLATVVVLVTMFGTIAAMKISVDLVFGCNYDDARCFDIDPSHGE